MFDRRSAAGLRARYEVRFGEDRFRLEVADGHFEAVRGSADRPDAVITTDPATLRRLAFGDRPLAAALLAGDVQVEGDRRAATRLLRLFGRPGPGAPGAD